MHLQKAVGAKRHDGGKQPMIFLVEADAQTVRSLIELYVDELVQSRRDTKAAERLLIRLLKNQHQSMKALAHLEAGPVPAFVTAAQRNCSFNEMTLSDVATDELIALLNESDGIRQQSFAQLLQSAARILTEQRL